MTCIIHKMLALLKNHQNYLKDNIFGSFKNYNRILSFLKNQFFSITYNNGKFKF